MSEESDLEKTEPASSRRLEQAREEGQVPQSRELMAFMVLLAGAGGMWALSGWMSHHAKNLLRHGLDFGHEAAFNDHAILDNLGKLTADAFVLVGPIFALIMVAAIAAPIMMGGFIFSFKTVGFDLSRINPVTGIKRVVSMQGVGELVKAVLKSALIGGFVFWVISRDGGAMLSLLSQPLERSVDSFFHLIFSGTMALVLGVAVIAAIDVPFQLWQYYSKMRMTREQVRQENKEMEGDPQMKARIRSQQRQIARRRMMSEVPKADVIVTNPTHFAVALKYDAEKMPAPKVIAKGSELVAQRIREIAEAHNIPILEAPPLARALHRHADIGSQVPSALYLAVAEVMAYVYQLNQFIADGGHHLTRPEVPTDLPVPATLDPGVAV
jgi:flagellar biosynthetic protein FlhB